jgi:hypothetical protein
VPSPEAIDFVRQVHRDMPPAPPPGRCNARTRASRLPDVLSALWAAYSPAPDGATVLLLTAPVGRMEGWAADPDQGAPGRAPADASPGG